MAMVMDAFARRYAGVEYPTTVVEEYDAQSAENEVLKEMPSLRCVLSGQRLWGAVTAEDGYSYDCDALQKYIKANGTKKAGSIDIIAPSPCTGESMNVGYYLWNEAVSTLARDVWMEKIKQDACSTSCELELSGWSK